VPPVKRQPLARRKVFVGFQVTNVFAPLPPRNHFVGNAGDGGLCCDPMTELMRAHFEEVPGAICKAEPLECGSDDRSSSLSPSFEKIVGGLLRQRFDQKSARLTLFMPEVPEDNKEALGKLLFRAVSPIDHPQVGHGRL
jgi:hypothetical protein